MCMLTEICTREQLTSCLQCRHSMRFRKVGTVRWKNVNLRLEKDTKAE